MDDAYELTCLALDTPDDDPRWSGMIDQMLMGFLEPSPTDEEVTRVRDNYRADQARVRMVQTPDSGLPDHPVSSFVSFDKQLNLGAEPLVRAELITDVTVRASHRRRGILREMMTTDLRQAKQRGCALAMLTASEGTIYGRFGFAPSSLRMTFEVHADKFALRHQPSGRVEYATAERAGEVYDQLVARLVASRRGQFERPVHQRAWMLGQWDVDKHGPERGVRLVVHTDEQGTPDGLGRILPIAGSDPTTIDFYTITTTSDAELALWQFAVDLDLVQRVKGTSSPHDPLRWALHNPRAIATKSLGDHFWVRILDVEQALSRRGWWRAGELVLQVNDPLELAQGRWAISVHDGVAQVSPTDRRPDAGLSVGTLGQLVWAGLDAASIVDAGLVDGDARAVLDLFAVPDKAGYALGF